MWCVKKTGGKCNHLQPPATTCDHLAPTCMRPAPSSPAQPHFRTVACLFTAAHLLLVFFACSIRASQCRTRCLMSWLNVPIEFRSVALSQSLLNFPFAPRERHHARVAHHRAPLLCGNKIFRPWQDTSDLITSSDGDQISSSFT